MHRKLLFSSILLISSIGCTPFSEDIVISQTIPTQFQNGTPLVTQPLPVLEVLDGEQIKVKLKEQVLNIHYALIDTPNSSGKHALRPERLGKEAKEFNLEWIKRAGNQVILVIDPVVQNQKSSDLLEAYVYLPNGKMMNEELLKHGLAKVKPTKPGMEYEKSFKKIDALNRSKKMGVWKEEGH